MKFFSYFCFAAIFFYVSSCTTQKVVVDNYLSNSRDTSGKQIINANAPLIQKGDLLSIKVFSKANGLDPKADAPYNLQETSTAQGGSSNGSSGFLVDRNGNIEYPQLGVMHVEGLTRENLSQLIKSRLDTVLINPSVDVRFLNYKVTVLGEVRNPGNQIFTTENVTILDALGSSGDITEYGKKDNVMVVRETNGMVETGRINLTSDSLFLSPYYHLQQGDVVMVEATPRKQKQQQEQQTTQRVSLGISIITAIALILTFFK
jgi:polysaccharide biosynthesis/export protein